MEKELETKLMDFFNKVSNKKSPSKPKLSKERKAKLYGKPSVIIFHTESGNLGVVLPTGFSSVKLNSLITNKQEEIQAFKTSEALTLKI